ncbi:MAG: cytochrome b/b6 domain-containing protein [Burkholderiales bacterium]
MPLRTNQSADLPAGASPIARDSDTRRVLIWDLPTRLFHWLLVASFFIALATGDPDRFRDIHVVSGYLVLALLAFRLAWGFAGSRYARFRTFTFGLAAVMRYLEDLLAGRPPRYLGHNPPGSWSIFAMLALGLVICVTGIVVLGAEESHGAMRGFSTYWLGEVVKALHEWLSWLMLGLVVAHVTGVLVESRAHHENLAKAMLTGYKSARAADGIRSSHWQAGLALLVCIAGAAGWLLQGRVAPDRYVPFVGKDLPDNKTWRAECGSCHTALHPTLLPARSWKALMDKQDDHFGDSLGLEPKTTAEILEFLQSSSAETGLTEAAYKINKSIPADQTPLRVTETRYWMEKHQGIEAHVWKHPKVGSKANCGACHQDADQGTYEDAAMRLPQ